MSCVLHTSNKKKKKKLQFKRDQIYPMARTVRAHAIIAADTAAGLLVESQTR